jgi:hypothetical protein
MCRVLPLVCKSFLAACEHAAQLWQRVQLSVLTLSAERLPCFVSWLAGHAPALRALVLHGRPLPTVEAALREQAGALAAALQAARGLQELELCRPLGAAVLARVDPLRLPCLRSVGVDFAAVGASRSGGGRGQRAQEAGEAEAATVNLMRLPALSELLLLSCLDVRDAGMRHWLTPCPVDSVCRRLTLAECRACPPRCRCHPLPPLQAALLARRPSLPPLQRVHFADTRDLPRTPALGPLAALHALSALRFSQRDGLALPGPLTALRALAYLHAAVRYRDDPLRVGPDLAALPSLRGLWLQHAVLEEPSCLGALPALSALGLVGCADAYPDVLHALALSTRLRALHLEAHATATAEVPPEAWRRLAAVGPGLTRLEMPHNRLRELPPGAYLESLQVRQGRVGRWESAERQRLLVWPACVSSTVCTSFTSACAGKARRRPCPTPPFPCAGA